MDSRLAGYPGSLRGVNKEYAANSCTSAAATRGSRAWRAIFDSGVFGASAPSAAGRHSHERAAGTNSGRRADGCSDLGPDASRRARGNRHHYWWRQTANVSTRQRPEA
jgi:hypothetical protein